MAGGVGWVAWCSPADGPIPPLSQPMNPDFAQRRRVFVAIAITVVAVPAAFAFGRGDDPDADSPPITIVAPAGESATTGPASAAAAASDNSAAADTLSEVLGTIPVGYLDGTVAPEANAPPMIAVPRRRDTVTTGQALFSRSISDVATCIIPAVPLGSEATVTNLDNSRSVKCQVVAVATPMPADVMLHPDAFAQIADITEAPVPVQVSW